MQQRKQNLSQKLWISVSLFVCVLLMQQNQIPISHIQANDIMKNKQLNHKLARSSRSIREICPGDDEAMISGGGGMGVGVHQVSPGCIMKCQGERKFRSYSPFVMAQGWCLTE